MTSDDIENQLGQYLSGRMSAEEKAQFEELIANDRSLSSDASLLEAVRSSMAGAAPARDTHAGWARLEAELDLPRPSQIQRSEVAANDNRVSPLWRIAAGILGFVAAGQLAFISQPGAKFAESDTARYYPVSEETREDIIVTVFRPDAEEEEIRALLSKTGGQFVSGPSALGIYRIGFDDAAARDEALTVFQANHQIVESADL